MFRSLAALYAISLSLAFPRTVDAHTNCVGEVAFFPAIPHDAHLTETSGVFEMFGYGQRSGSLTLMTPTGEQFYKLAAPGTVAINGKRFLCQANPIPKFNDCPRWPSSIVPGKTLVYVKSFPMTFNGKPVQVVSEISTYR